MSCAYIAVTSCCFILTQMPCSSSHCWPLSIPSSWFPWQCFHASALCISWWNLCLLSHSPGAVNKACFNCWVTPCHTLYIGLSQGMGEPQWKPSHWSQQAGGDQWLGRRGGYGVGGRCSYFSIFICFGPSGHPYPDNLSLMTWIIKVLMTSLGQASSEILTWWPRLEAALYKVMIR